jgi:hypothetical protein
LISSLYIGEEVYKKTDYLKYREIIENYFLKKLKNKNDRNSFLEDALCSQLFMTRLVLFEWKLNLPFVESIFQLLKEISMADH